MRHTGFIPGGGPRTTASPYSASNTDTRVRCSVGRSKVLAETLRAMERDGPITRTAYDENPPRVAYALTSPSAAP